MYIYVLCGTHYLPTMYIRTSEHQLCMWGGLITLWFEQFIHYESPHLLKVNYFTTLYHVFIISITTCSFQRAIALHMFLCKLEFSKMLCALVRGGFVICQHKASRNNQNFPNSFWSKTLRNHIRAHPKPPPTHLKPLNTPKNYPQSPHKSFVKTDQYLHRRVVLYCFKFCRWHGSRRL